MQEWEALRREARQLEGRLEVSKAFEEHLCDVAGGGSVLI